MNQETLQNAPIRGLQQMLRAISFIDTEIPAVIPDGVFGAATKAAVSAYQQKYGFPVTGDADLATFQAIAESYDAAMVLLGPAEAPVILFPAELTILEGQSHPHVYLAQAMLTALHQTFPEIRPTPLTGRNDSATGENLRHLQSLSGRPETGALDKPTYNDLARMYRISYDRALPPANG